MKQIWYYYMAALALPCMMGYAGDNVVENTKAAILVAREEHKAVRSGAPLRQQLLALLEQEQHMSRIMRHMRRRSTDNVRSAQPQNRRVSMELSMADKLERYNFWQDPTRKKTKSPTIGRRLTAGASPVNPGIKVEKKKTKKKMLQCRCYLLCGGQVILRCM